MKVIGKIFDRNPSVMEIGNKLEDIKKFIGGYMETPFISDGLRQRKIVLVVNEEGSLLNLRPTLALVRNDKVVFCLRGQLFFCGVEDDELVDLNREQEEYIMSNLVFKGAYTDQGLEVDVLFV